MRNAETVLGIIQDRGRSPWLWTTLESRVLRKAHARFGEGRMEKCRSRQLASRLLYFLLGFSGPRHEAEEIKQRIGQFLRDILRLELSETKTLITHARSNAARFLGYEVVALHADERHDQRGQRIINGLVRLKVPTKQKVS